jgi:hypothetical protein
MRLTLSCYPWMSWRAWTSRPELHIRAEAVDL